MNRLTLLAACALALTLLVSDARAVEAPVWDDVSVSMGLVGSQPETMVPIWYDIDLDGRRDPLWLSYDGVEAMVTGEDGELTLMPVDMPAKFEEFVGPEMLGIVLDVDGDGDEEILVLGIEPGILEVSEPFKLVQAQSSLPPLPGASTGDVAAGDLNADGLPDLVIGFGVFSLDRIERRGFPDGILMNLGEGRFQWHYIEPRAYAFTHGMTLADMDGDGRLDIVESFNSSQLTTLARVLLNRTSVGGLVPVFEVSPYAHDTGTNGMGAAVADIDGDGWMDVYNTSVGLDQLCMGTPDGACVDETVERGLLAEWGIDSMRQQWAPTFADLNADGRLDLIVRHGGVGGVGDESIGALGWRLATSEADLVYLQNEEHNFVRVQAPFEFEVAPNGRQLVLGDLDDDGLPDVALGGENGSAGFWRNVTDAASRRPLTVRLRGTVSGHPPTGATITGTCETQTQKRHLTSGGKMGGSPTPEVWLAFPDCTGEAQVSVLWPSGARTTLPVGEELRVLDVVEPTWFQSTSGDAPTLTLDPAAAGAQQACTGSASTPWSCCQAQDAPCVLPVETPPGEEIFVRLDDHPMRALSLGLSRWTLSSEPSPPRPGSEVIWRLHHVGDPAQMDPNVSLFVDGEVLAWQAYPSAPSTLSAKSSVPFGQEHVEVTLFPPDLPPAVTWSVETGSVFEASQQIVDVYAYRVLGGVTEPWSGEVFTTFMRQLDLSQIYDNAALRTSSMKVLDAHKNVVDASVARLRLVIDWDTVEGEDTLHLVDLQGASDIPFPLPKPITLEEAVHVVDHAGGGMAKNRLVVGGDIGPVFFTLHDKTGAVMPPEPELVTFEVVGGTSAQDISIFAGAYNLYAMIETDAEPGEGQVRILSVDGRLLGAFPFYKRAAGIADVEIASSSAFLDAASASEAPATHRARVFPVNAFDEFSGPGTIVELDIEGGEQISQTIVDAEGGLTCMIEASPTAEQLLVDVHVQGIYLTTLTADLEPAPPTDVADTSGAEIAEEEASLNDSGGSGGSGGCGGCAGSPGSSGDGWLVLVALWALRPRREPS